MMTPCSVCKRQWNHKAKALETLIPFVCRMCRCADCQIVFEYACDCGTVHGKRKQSDTAICTDCEEIRERIMQIDPDMLKQRIEECALEEPLYD